MGAVAAVLVRRRSVTQVPQGTRRPGKTTHAHAHACVEQWPTKANSRLALKKRNVGALCRQPSFAMARRGGVAFAALPLELLTLLMRSLCARDMARLARAVPAFSRPGSYFDEAVAALLAELHSVGCGEHFVLPAETALHRLARLTGRRLTSRD